MKKIKVKSIMKILCFSVVVSSIISFNCFANGLLSEAKTDGIKDNLWKIDQLSERIVKLAVDKGRKPTSKEIKILISSVNLKYIVKSFKVGEYDSGGDILIKYKVTFKDDNKTLFNESLLKLVNGEVYKRNKKCPDVIASMKSSDIKMLKGYGESSGGSSENWSKITVYDKQKLAKLLRDFKSGKVGFSEMNRIMQQEIAKGNVQRYRLRSNPMIILTTGEQLN